MRCYAVIDTNVLVSSLMAKRPDSATVHVLDAIVGGEIIPLYCDEILDEYDDVLRRDKFPFSGTTIDGVLLLIRSYGVEVTPHSTGVVLPDTDDLVFYEIVMSKREEDEAYLVTGNIKHFPRASFIVTPAEMMEIIGSAD